MASHHNGPAGGADRRSHHISSIAHHFLPEAGEDHGGRRLHVVVAAPGAVRSTAAVTAGLATVVLDAEIARGQRRAALLLREPEDPLWSALSWLDSTRFASVTEVESLPDLPFFPAGDRVFCLLPVPALTAPGPGFTEVQLEHVGAAGGRWLERIEAGRRLLGGACGGPDPLRTLIWCLSEAGAECLGGMQILGRVVRAWQPQRVTILLTADDDSAGGGAERTWPRRLIELARPGGRRPSGPSGKLKRRVAAVCPESAVTVTGPGEMGDVLREIGEHLTVPD